MVSASLSAVSDVLGLRRNPARPGTPLGLMGEVERGLPLSASTARPRRGARRQQLCPPPRAAGNLGRHVRRLRLGSRPRELELLAGSLRQGPSPRTSGKTMSRHAASCRGLHPESAWPPMDVVLAGEVGRPSVEAISAGSNRYGSVMAQILDRVLTCLSNRRSGWQLSDLRCDRIAACTWPLEHGSQPDHLCIRALRHGDAGDRRRIALVGGGRTSISCRSTIPNGLAYEMLNPAYLPGWDDILRAPAEPMVRPGKRRAARSCCSSPARSHGWSATC